MYAKCCRDKDADENEATAKKHAAARKRAEAEHKPDIDDVTLKYRRPPRETDTLQELEVDAVCVCVRAGGRAARARAWCVLMCGMVCVV
jgi:hypothetical protein